jgi:hypothetical protein
MTGNGEGYVCREACGHHHDGDPFDPRTVVTGPPCAGCVWCRQGGTPPTPPAPRPLDLAEHLTRSARMHPSPRGRARSVTKRGDHGRRAEVTQGDASRGGHP